MNITVNSQDKHDNDGNLKIAAAHRCRGRVKIGRWGSGHQCAQKGHKHHAYHFCKKHGDEHAAQEIARQVKDSAVQHWTGWQANPDQTSNERDENGAYKMMKTYRVGHEWHDRWLQLNSEPLKLLFTMEQHGGLNFLSTYHDGEEHATQQSLSDWFKAGWERCALNALAKDEAKPWEAFMEYMTDTSTAERYYDHQFVSAGNSNRYYHNEYNPYDVMGCGEVESPAGHSGFMSAVGLEYDLPHLVNTEVVDEFARRQGEAPNNDFRWYLEDNYYDEDSEHYLNKRQLRKFEEWKAETLASGRSRLIEQFTWTGSRMEDLAVQVAENLFAGNSMLRRWANEFIESTGSLRDSMSEINDQDYTMTEEEVTVTQWSHWFDDDWADNFPDADYTPPERKKRQTKKTIATALKELDVDNLSTEEMTAALRALQAGETPV